MREWVACGTDSTLPLSLLTELSPADRHSLHGILATLGCRCLSEPTEQVAAPSLRLRRLRDHALARSLGEMLPGDAVWCLRDGQVAQYCRDGVVRYRENEPGTEILLSPDFPPGLGGALGLGLVRGFSIAGHLILHAAAVRYRGLTVLALGPSGAGKTTLCAAAIRAGGQVVSDDLILLAEHAPADEIRALWLHPFRADMLLREGGHRTLPDALAASLQPERRLTGRKLRLHRSAAPDMFVARAPLSCIAVLGHGPRQARSQVRPLDQAEALVGVLSALLYRLSPIARAPLMRAARRLASSYPAVRLDVGSRLLASPVDELDRIHAALLPTLDAARATTANAAHPPEADAAGA